MNPLLVVVGLVVAVGQLLGVVYTAVASSGSSPTLNIGFGFTASAAAIVVGIMAWIVRKVVSGEVVPLPISQLVQTQQDLINKLDARAESAESDKELMAKLVEGSTQAMFAVNDWLRRQPRT